MFQSLRNQSQVYVFFKGAAPRVEIGTVKDVSKTPAPNQFAMPIMAYGQQPREETLNVTVTVNGQDIEFQSVPYLADVMDYPSRGLFLSDNKDAINAEVSSYQNLSEVALSEDTKKYHMGIIDGCKQIREKLNPEYAAQQAQQGQIDALNEKLDALIKMINSGAVAAKAKNE